MRIYIHEITQQLQADVLLLMISLVVLGGVGGLTITCIVTSKSADGSPTTLTILSFNWEGLSKNLPLQMSLISSTLFGLSAASGPTVKRGELGEREAGRERSVGKSQDWRRRVTLWPLLKEFDLQRIDGHI